MFRRRLLLLLSAAALAASCGGGGGGSAPAAPIGNAGTPTPAASSVPQGTARASFTITVPNASTSSKKRGTKAVPANAAFIQFTLLKTTGTGGSVGTPGPLNPLTAGSPGCTAVSGGEQCIIALAAPVGSDIYTATIYAADGTTNLGSGAVNIAVAANTANASTLTLGGTLSYVLLETDNVVGQQLFFQINGNEEITTTALQPLVSPLANIAYPYSNLPGDIPTSSRIFVIGIDQYGNQIIAPDQFSTPVTLSVSASSPVEIDAKKRKPRDEDPAQIAGYLTVTYAYPVGAGSASTSASYTTVQVLSPADKIVFTPYSLDTSNFFNISATVQGSTATSPPNTNPLQFFVLDGMCAPGATGGTGAPYDCEQPAGTPPPTATPSELAFGNVVGNDAQLGYGAGIIYFELPSITDPSVFSVGFNDQLGNTPTLNAAPATSAQDAGVPANNAASCALFTFSANGNAQSSPTFTIPYKSNADSSGDTYLLQFQESSLTAGTTCEMAVSANGATLLVNIQANNVTGGTIQ
jgi:hypothetical protein